MDARRFHARVRFSLFAVLAFAAAAACVPAFNVLAAELALTGWYEYVSLLVSDTGSLGLVWRELAFTLAEATPLFAVTLLLGCVFASLAFARKAVRSLRAGSGVLLVT